VQADPFKPKLKPPGTKRLKLKRDIMRSTSAFIFNLRRYNVELYYKRNIFAAKVQSTFHKVRVHSFNRYAR